ncbi:hypothetical protein U1Q18_039817 [Sarracenia purpurea var. burkii]
MFKKYDLVPNGWNCQQFPSQESQHIIDMKNAAAASLNLVKNLYETNIRTVANHYAGHLQLFYQHSPCSYSLARCVYAHMITSGFRPRGHILNRLIDIYCKLSDLVCAHHLFDIIPEPDIVGRTMMIAAYSVASNPELAWEIFSTIALSVRDTDSYNAMITAYSRNEDGHATIELYRDMRRENLWPDNFTFTTTLSALELIADRETHCQQLDCVVVKSGTESATSVVNALISVYVKCASSPLASSSPLMAAARKLFDGMLVKDELSWTTIITGYIRNDDLYVARQIFDGMDEKLVAAWNTMISGYVHNGFVPEALELFRRMHLSGIKHDEFMYSGVLSACANA